MNPRAAAGHYDMPKLEERSALPYVGLRRTVTIAGLPEAIDRDFPALFAQLAERGVAPSGPPFIRYLKVDMERELEIELGVPVDGDAGVHTASLPAGAYAVLVHVGPYGGLRDAHDALQQWADERGFAWSERIETYVTNPRREPDSSRWETEVALF
jgi:effector-binding domain-containing protein